MNYWKWARLKFILVDKNGLKGNRKVKIFPYLCGKRELNKVVLDLENLKSQEVRQTINTTGN